MFIVVVTEVRKDDAAKTDGVERYRQTVDEINMRAIIAAVNQKPRKPRTAKEPAK